MRRRRTKEDGKGVTRSLRGYYHEGDLPFFCKCAIFMFMENTMTIQETVKKEIDSLSTEALYAVRDFLLFQKYRSILELDDTSYLNSISGMSGSIKDGIKAPLSECVPLSNVWPDV